MLEHGGRLLAASRHYAIPPDGWLDLSTGIAPWPYPAPAIPASAWQRLPEDDDGLREAACAYYAAAHVTHILPLAGSQAAILALPRLRVPGTVAVLAPTYGEYAPAWRAAGHRVAECMADELLRQAADVIMLANPNNPDGMRFACDELLAAAQGLAKRGGWLIVDEAFADVDAVDSLAAVAGTAQAENVIVLRSLGKFFGLAGARVGFCIAAPALLARLKEMLGPWPIAHPSRCIAKVGLGDTAWQVAQNGKLRTARARLAQLLTAHGLPPAADTALFAYVPCAAAAALHEFLAWRGILVRCFAEPAALRFGLPATENDWMRLACALAGWGSK
jgi:L-threonine-O-3-phosphate decarboxylase